jgi:glycosyltransferase involved in cell wall biosynthesis
VRILGFGTYDRLKHPRVGIILDGLGATGDEVTENNAPLGLSTAERVAMLQRPWLVVGLGTRLLARWWQLARRSRSGPAPDAVIVGYLGHFDVLLARVLYRSSTIVLDQMVFAADTASDRRVGGARRQKVLRAIDHAALRAADVVVLDTEAHRALVPAKRQNRVVVVPVGASLDWLAAAPAPGPGRGPLQVVFFGLFTPLQGGSVIGRALAQLADRDDITVTMIGSGQDSDLVKGLTAGNRRISWRDWVEPDELAPLVAEHDVCLGIFGTGPKALRVVPNKLYQGAAARCALITSDTSPQRDAFGGAAIFVPPGDPAALSAALAGLAGDRGRARDLGMAAQARYLEAFTPERVVRPLRSRLETTRPETTRRASGSDQGIGAP